jgi:phosphoserine phosphatase
MMTRALVAAAQPESSSGLRGVVAFDFDGTLLRGPTTCELLAQPLGRLAEMRRFETLSSDREIAAARLEMARWYQGRSPEQLCAALESATWAPGALEGVRLLQEGGVEVIIASITWQFAVEWLARRLGVSRVLGTQLESSGQVSHVWPRDKARWVRQVSSELGIGDARVAAVGDSNSDAELLSAASLRFFVGPGSVPSLAGVNHRPGGDIAAIAREILESWAA